MDDEVEYLGHWWLPGKKRQKLPGTMKFSPSEGVSLVVNGTFDKKDRINPFGTMILGESAFGEAITLYQCFLTGGTRSFSAPARGISKFFANKAFIGCHFERMDDARFKTIAFRPSYFDEWLGMRKLDVKQEAKGFTLSYKMPDDLVLPISKGLEIRIAFSFRGPNQGSEQDEVTFQQHAYFTIHKQGGDHFNGFGQIITQLSNFLALPAMSPVYPIETIGFRDARTKSERSKRIGILLPTYHAAQNGTIRFFDMLFTYKEVAERLEEYVRNWIIKQETLEPVFELFFNTLYTSGANPIVVFLNYAQAIETYHSRKMKNEVDPPEVHKERIRAILSMTPEKHEGWLKDKLSFTNMPSLADRLREVINLNPIPVNGMAGSHEYFIKRVRNSRNYYTHYNPDLKEKAEPEAGVRGMNMVLGTMIEAILLHEMGLGFQEINAMQGKRRKLPITWR